jgi:hypothetical protein
MAPFPLGRDSSPEGKEFMSAFEFDTAAIMAALVAAGLTLSTTAIALHQRKRRAYERAAGPRRKRKIHLWSTVRPPPGGIPEKFLGLLPARFADAFQRLVVADFRAFPARAESRWPGMSGVVHLKAMKLL